MKIFSSKTPRDLNHDPEPWRIWTGPWINTRTAVAVPGMSERDPRPEFDHVQHNEPNRILVSFRERGDAEYPDEWWTATIALRSFGGYTEWNDERSYFHELTLATDDEARHAGRVLAKLTALKEQS